MSVSWPGSMRSPQLKTPRLLLLLLLLLSSLTATVLCQDEDSTGGAVEENPVTEPETLPETKTEPGPVPGLDPAPDEYPGPGPLGDDVPETSDPSTADPETTDPKEDPVVVTTNNGGSGNGLEVIAEATANPNSVIPSVSPPGDTEGLSPVIILIPVVLVVLIIAMIVCGIFINRRWNQKASDQELRKEDPYLDGTSTEKVPMPMFEEDVPSVLELEMHELDQWMKKDGETTEDSKLP